MKLTKSRQAATIFYIFFSIVFVVLGFWQINRGNEKTEIIEAFELQQTGQAIEFSSDSQKWERVYISGKLDDERIIYLDNVIHKGILGFKVLAPVFIEDNKVMLVDFGWIKQPQSRDQVSFISISDNENVSVSGVLEAPEMGLILSEDDKKKIVRIQSIARGNLQRKRSMHGDRLRFKALKRYSTSKYENVGCVNVL